MRIYEIVFWDHDPTEESRSIDFFPSPLDNDLANLARAAFTRRGLVKHLWYTRGSEGQLSGPATRTETDMIPNGSVEPSTSPLPAEPVDAEPPVGQHRLRPFSAVLRGVSAD
jgi:hypothetical protein